MSLSLRAYAAHRKSQGLSGGTLSAVQAAVKAGRLRGALTKDGKIRDAADADSEWVQTTHADRVPLRGPVSNGHAAPNPLQEHRARREAAEAAMAEIELAEKQRSLVPAADVEAHLVNVFANCRTKLLGLPARARAQDPSLSSEQIAMFDRLLHECLEDLADGSTKTA